MTNPTVSSATQRAMQKHPSRFTRKVSAKAPERTKATVFTVSQLLETYRDPRAILLEVASMSIADLVAATQCTPLEALAEKRLCAQAVLPYVCQKLPVQVDMRHTKAIHLNIVDDATYGELTALTGDDPSAMSVRVIESKPVEATDVVDVEQGQGEGGRMSVAPPVPATPHSGAAPSEQASQPLTDEDKTHNI